MKTQLSILVKNESLFSRFYSFLWFINIFKKMSVVVCIDGDQANAKTLKASKEPYLIDVTPGQHQILITDPRAGNKQAFKAFSGAVVGSIFSIATDGVIDSSDFASEGSTIRDGVVQCVLNEGDVLRISAKPKHNGSVKVKILK